MMTQTLLEKSKIQKIGKTPVVVLPLKIWQEIENKLEELEMDKSLFLRKKISKARKEKNFYSPSQAKKNLENLNQDYGILLQTERSLRFEKVA